MRIEKEGLTLRTLCPGDEEVLLKWLTDPRVLAFYEGRDAAFTRERIQEMYFGHSERVTRCLLLAEESPVGYLQFYPVSTEEDFAEYGFADPGGFVYALDLFLGIPERWGEGLGRRFISMLLGYLSHEKGAEAVLLDPRAANERAIRCYEGCGFQKEKLLFAHELHEGVYEDCWLMCWRAEGQNKAKTGEPK